MHFPKADNACQIARGLWSRRTSWWMPLPFVSARFAVKWKHFFFVRFVVPLRWRGLCVCFAFRSLRPSPVPPFLPCFEIPARTCMPTGTVSMCFYVACTIRAPSVGVGVPEFNRMHAVPPEGESG